MTSGPAKVTIYGKQGSPQAYAIRDFLYRSDVPFEWVPITSDEDARLAGLERVDDRRFPVCRFPDGSRMEAPTIRQITEKLGWFHGPSRSEYDLAIYGAGPAGLSAAVYGASEGLKTVVIERWAVGGQAGSSPKIENYLGFPSGVAGADLAERAREQACRFGAEILLAREGVRGEFSTGKRVGYLADGTKIVARSAICATGVGYHKLGLPNENEFLGAGLYYGAGASEAALCGDQHVLIVGGGNSAGQAALQLSACARSIDLIVRADSLKCTLSAYLLDRIHAARNIHVFTNTEVVELIGNEFLEAVKVRNRCTGEFQTFETRWLFVCIGGAPHTEWAAEAGVLRDEGGYLITGPDFVSQWPPR